MTEDTHIYLTEAGSKFQQAMAQAAAEVLKEVPEEDRLEAVYYLQDHTSLFSPYVAELIRKELER